MRFAFRIGNHFGFSDGADKDLAMTQISVRCSSSATPFASSGHRKTYSWRHVHRQFSHHWRGLEANAAAEAPEFPSERTRSSTASSNSLLGWRGAHAVPVIYMRRELHRKWLDGDTPTTRSRPTRPASSARRNMRVFTVASAMPIISATSLTDLDRTRTSVPGRTSRHRKESAGR
jgi:hypothetical protein